MHDLVVAAHRLPAALTRQLRSARDAAIQAAPSGAPASPWEIPPASHAASIGSGGFGRQPSAASVSSSSGLAVFTPLHFGSAERGAPSPLDTGSLLSSYGFRASPGPASGPEPGFWSAGFASGGYWPTVRLRCEVRSASRVRVTLHPVDVLDAVHASAGCSSAGGAPAAPFRRRSSAASPPMAGTTLRVECFSGNPAVEVWAGYLVLLDCAPGTEAAHHRTVCVPSAPGYLVSGELLRYLGAYALDLEHLRLTRAAAPGKHHILLQFADPRRAAAFRADYDGARFSSLEADRARALPVLLYVPYSGGRRTPQPHAAGPGTSAGAGPSDAFAAAAAVDLWQGLGPGQASPSPDGAGGSGTCAVCLESLTADTEGATSAPVVTTTCNHSFHLACLSPWAKVSDGCPVCRHGGLDDDGGRSACHDCGVTDGLLLCVVCGHIGCLRAADGAGASDRPAAVPGSADAAVLDVVASRGGDGHGAAHFALTGHRFALDLTAAERRRRVWDFVAGDTVDRLVLNKVDGQPVAMPGEGSASASATSGAAAAAPSDGGEEAWRIDGVVREFSLVLAQQLEEQRAHFEAEMSARAAQAQEDIAAARAQLEAARMDDGGETLGPGPATTGRDEAATRTRAGIERLSAEEKRLQSLQALNLRLAGDQDALRARAGTARQEAARIQAQVDDVKEETRDLAVHARALGAIDAANSPAHACATAAAEALEGSVSIPAAVDPSTSRRSSRTGGPRPRRG